MRNASTVETQYSLPEAFLYCLHNYEAVQSKKTIFMGRNTVNHSAEVPVSYGICTKISDKMMEQMTMKEYMDPFTGSKNSKA